MNEEQAREKASAIRMVSRGSIGAEVGSKYEVMVQIARSAAKNARAQYSNFPVGAAVEAADGRIYLGCNIESASYSLTICAERVAIFSAIAADTTPHRLAVSCLRGDSSDPGSLMPCGACRQVMLDQMPPDAIVIVDGVGSFTVANLIPMGFRLPAELSHTDAPSHEAEVRSKCEVMVTVNDARAS